MIRAKVITLLGQGYPPVTVASSLGITESRVSQIASEPEAAAEIQSLRFNALQKYNDLDSKYLSVEEALLAKLESSLIFLQRPMEIARALQIVNGTKRRGQESPETTQITQNIVNISMPSQVLQKFIVNGANQVVQAGEQTLLTIPSNQMGALANDLSTKERLPAGTRAISKITATDL